MAGKIKIMIADDHALFRKGIISLIEEDQEMNVIGEASNGRELLTHMKVEEPNVVLLDLDMPVMDGNETLLLIRKEYPNVKVIIISIHFSYELTLDLMRKGASACLPKECDPEILWEAINTVGTEKYYYSTSTVEKSTEYPHYFDKSTLSEREIEVIKLICEGKTNKEKANILKITTYTVDFHRKNIYRKTGQHNPASLTLFAVWLGLISARNNISQ